MLSPYNIRRFIPIKIQHTCIYICLLFQNTISILTAVKKAHKYDRRIPTGPNETKNLRAEYGPRESYLNIKLNFSPPQKLTAGRISFTWVVAAWGMESILSLHMINVRMSRSWSWSSCTQPTLPPGLLGKALPEQLWHSYPNSRCAGTELCFMQRTSGKQDRFEQIPNQICVSYNLRKLESTVMLLITISQILPLFNYFMWECLIFQPVLSEHRI